MGSFLSIPILALAVTLQVTVVPQFAILGGRPDLVFLLVIAWTLNSDLEEAVTWAFVGGLMKDLMSINPLGTSIVGMVIVVFGIYFVRQQIYNIGLIALTWIILLGTLVQQITTLIILFITGFQPISMSILGLTPLVQEIAYVIPPTMIYNLVAIFPVYWLVRRVQRRVVRERRFFQ
jgi:rod shape-determining protein MreD